MITIGLVILISGLGVTALIVYIVRTNLKHKKEYENYLNEVDRILNEEDELNDER